MPLPKPQPQETQSEFISRCIRFETKASPDRDPKQIQAICFQVWRDRFKKSKKTSEARGQGVGMGGSRQGDGGAKYCICPKCNYFVEHKRSTPCQKIKCPKCGALMVGTNVKPKSE